MGTHGTDGTYQAFRSVVPLSLHDWRIATAGDVGNIVANGGGTASDSAPALSGTAATVSQQLNWIAGNATQVLIQRPLPEDFDGKQDVFIELWVASGTTDAASFTVLTNWGAAAADISDTATDGAKSATIHKISATISAADIPDNAAFVSVALTPATHATDAILLASARLTYLPKRVS